MSLCSWAYLKQRGDVLLLLSTEEAGSTPVAQASIRGVYMIPARLSFRYEFSPVPSCGSVFVYMIPTQNPIPERVHPGHCTGARFSSQYDGTTSCSSRREITSPGSLERLAYVVFDIQFVYLNRRRMGGSAPE